MEGDLRFVVKIRKDFFKKNKLIKRKELQQELNIPTWIKKRF